MSKNGRSIVPVILSGGSGTRLWPLSRQALPKQLLPLAGARTLIQETAARAIGPDFAEPVVICNEDHRFLIAEQLRVAGAASARIVLEPIGRNTAPAAAIAALLVEQDNPGALMLLMPSDHVVANLPAFHAAVSVAAEAASAGSLVTFGVEASLPETGYGYIRRDAPLPGLEGAFRVARFVEKPDLITAQRYVASGEYCWNSGMFLFRAKDFLDEMERLQPAILAACRAALAQATRETDFIRLGNDFQACPAQSIDYAVMEHTDKAAVVPADMGWNDVGSWQSLWDIAARSEAGNALVGDVLIENSGNSYIRSEGPLVAAVGVDNLVVVATRDAVLVAHRDAAQDVKKIVEQLQSGKRNHHIHHPVVHRPWGTYESIAAGSQFQVKHIMVKSGAKLSLQMHHHRAEHWIVVSGEAIVTCGDSTFPLTANQSTFIPLGARHRLENPAAEPLHLIEVQFGSYLGEDDIVRFDDSYGRVPQVAADA